VNSCVRDGRRLRTCKREWHWSCRRIRWCISTWGRDQKRFEGHRPTVGVVMGDGVIVWGVAMVASCFLVFVGVRESE
jgi:hypothetical protein